MSFEESNTMLMAIMLLIPVVFTQKLDVNNKYKTLEITTSEPIKCPEGAVDNQVNTVVILTFLNIMLSILCTVLCAIIYFKYMRKNSVSESSSSIYSLSCAENGKGYIQENQLGMDCPFVEQSNEHNQLRDGENNSRNTLVKMLDETKSEPHEKNVSNNKLHPMNGNCKLGSVNVEELLLQGNEVGLPLIRNFLPENLTCETIRNCALDAKSNSNFLMKNNSGNSCLIHTTEVELHKNKRILQNHNISVEDAINQLNNLSLCVYGTNTEGVRENNEISTLPKFHSYTKFLEHKLLTINEESELQLIRNFDDSSISATTQNLLEIENARKLLQQDECFVELGLEKNNVLEENLRKKNNINIDNGISNGVEKIENGNSGGDNESVWKASAETKNPDGIGITNFEKEEPKDSGRRVSFGDVNIKYV